MIRNWQDPRKHAILAFTVQFKDVSSPSILTKGIGYLLRGETVMTEDHNN